MRNTQVPRAHTTQGRRRGRPSGLAAFRETYLGAPTPAANGNSRTTRANNARGSSSTTPAARARTHSAPPPTRRRPTASARPAAARLGGRSTRRRRPLLAPALAVGLVVIAWSLGLGSVVGSAARGVSTSAFVAIALLAILAANLGFGERGTERDNKN